PNGAMVGYGRSFQRCPGYHIRTPSRFGHRGHDMILSVSRAVPLHCRMVAGQAPSGCLPEKNKEQLRSCGYVAQAAGARCMLASSAGKFKEIGVQPVEVRDE